MFQVGEIIKWYETYAYGDIIKDAGLGVLLKVTGAQCFQIFRIKKGDTIFVSKNEIEKINKE